MKRQVSDTIKVVSTEEFAVLHRCAAAAAKRPSIVHSAHGDTCFGESNCVHVPESNGALFYGHMDNASGVHALMKAYFSGGFPPDRVQSKITYGEEKAMNGVYFAGAREVMQFLKPDDLVVVIDVTGACSRSVSEDTIRNADKIRGHVIIEKVQRNEKILALLRLLPGLCMAVSGIPTPESGHDQEDYSYTYEIYHHCNDPQAFEDETDAYKETQKNTFFIGIPTTGGSAGELTSDGDYNAGPVFCWKSDIEAVSMLLVDLANVFVSPGFQSEYVR